MKKKIVALLFVIGSLHPFFISISKAQYTKLLDFSGTINGNAPSGDLIYDGTFLYGMTRFGGVHNPCSCYGFGVIFKIKPDGTSYAKLFDFDGINGGSPQGSLNLVDSFLYGMSETGIFKIKPDGTGYSTLLAFTGSNGASPTGSLIYDGTYLYGMTRQGGTNLCPGCDGDGVLFKIKPNGTGYLKLIDFVYSNGAGPIGSLISDGTYLYGMTSGGGTCGQPYGCGVLFKIKPDGTDYTKLLDFDGTNGWRPFGSLIFDGTFLYGMTALTIFKIKPDGSGFSKLLDIAATTGSLISDGTFLYGMTYEGGTSGVGNIFKIKSDGTEYANLLDFTGPNGSDPHGSLIIVDNTLYGMTASGGTNNMGVIFSYNLGITTNLNNLPGNEIPTKIDIFPNPSTSVVSISISSAKPVSEFILKVNDPIGKTVYSETIKDFNNSFTKQIDLSHLPKGFYFIELQQHDTSTNTKAFPKEVKKIVLQ